MRIFHQNSKRRNSSKRKLKFCYSSYKQANGITKEINKKHSHKIPYICKTIFQNISLEVVFFFWGNILFYCILMILSIFMFGNLFIVCLLFGFAIKFPLYFLSVSSKMKLKVIINLTLLFSVALDELIFITTLLKDSNLL